MNTKQKALAFSLFENFKKETISQEDLSNANGKAKKLSGYANTFKVIVSLVKDAIAGNFKISKTNLAILIAAIAYVVSPIDAIPDVIPVLGWVDDTFIVAYVVKRLSGVLEEYKQWKDIN